MEHSRRTGRSAHCGPQLRPHGARSLCPVQPQVHDARVSLHQHGLLAAQRGRASLRPLTYCRPSPHSLPSFKQSPAYCVLLLFITAYKHLFFFLPLLFAGAFLWRGGPSPRPPPFSRAGPPKHGGQKKSFRVEPCGRLSLYSLSAMERHRLGGQSCKISARFLDLRPTCESRAVE